MLRPSRPARVIERLTRIRKIQVLSELRASKEGNPSSTASQVSWATSSATSALFTKVRAIRTKGPCQRSTIEEKAASSPARSRFTRAASPTRAAAISPVWAAAAR